MALKKFIIVIIIQETISKKIVTAILHIPLTCSCRRHLELNFHVGVLPGIPERLSTRWTLIVLDQPMQQTVAMKLVTT